MLAEKKLMPGETRFVPKQMGLAKSSLWGVYDRARGLYPGDLVAYGRVAQNHKAEDSAKAEADRLNKFYAAR